MNLFDTASKIVHNMAPDLPKNYVRKNIIAALGTVSATTPVSGQMFNPEQYIPPSQITGAIENILSRVPQAKFRTDFFS